MTDFLRYHAVLILICLFNSTTAFPPSGLDSPRRNVPCRREKEYQEKTFCCLNCPPGTYVKSPCSQPGEFGQCEECEDGTFAEHPNEFKQCFTCTRCHADQDTVRQCSHTQDSECQCKAGGFCASDEACEVCRKCSRCNQDQTIVRNCTATSDTECKKATPPSGSVRTIITVGCVLLIGVVIVVAVVFLWKKMYSAADGETRGLKAAQLSTEDPRNVENRPLVRVHTPTASEDLCESLSSTACNSQHSLTSLTPTAPPAPAPPAYVLVPRPTASREDEFEFPKLVPVNGEESLRKCFEYFEEVDVDYHKRFFRHLGISDNVIKGKELLPYEDRIHDLLNVWVEQKGRDASLNDLLKALLDLNQRRTAETVKENAVGQGHYVCEGH